MFKNTNSKKWPLNRSVIVYQKGPPPQQQRIRKDEDWAGLAQKWVQMRETTDSSSASNGRPNNNVPPKDKDPRAAENLKVSYSELEDLATGRMSNYPVLPPSYIGFALDRSKELNSKKKVSLTSSSESKKDADNSYKRDPILIRKRQNIYSCDKYPNKLPFVSDSTEYKLTNVQNNAARNILIEKYKLQHNETTEMISVSLLASSLKSKSDCEISFSNLNDQKFFTLTGTREAIDLAKELIQKIIEKVHPVSGLETMDVLEQQIEINIPENKVSNVIGPYGSTIKLLNEQTGCKINIIIDSINQVFNKKLWITGESAKCRRAQELIESLINAKTSDEQSKIINDLKPNTNQFKPKVESSCISQFNQEKYQEATFYVPTKVSGMIFGLKGEIITQLKEQAGLLKLELSFNILPDRHKKLIMMCGTPQAIYCAKQLIQEKIKVYQVKARDFSPELTRQANDLEVASYPWLNNLLGTIPTSKNSVSTTPLKVTSYPWLNNSLGTKATMDSKNQVSTTPLKVASYPWLNNLLRINAVTNDSNPVSTTPLEVASYPWLNNYLGTKAAMDSKNPVSTTPLEVASYPWLNNSIESKDVTDDSKNPVSTSSLQQTYISLLNLIGMQSSQEDPLACILDSVKSAQQFGTQYSPAIPYQNSTAECIQSGIVQYDNFKAGQHQKSHMVHKNFVAGQSQTLQNVLPFMSDYRCLPAEQNWHLPLSSDDYLQTEQQYQQPSMIQNKHLLPR